MKKGIIVGLIALTLLVGAIFVANISASEPDPELKFAACNLSFADSIYIKYAVKGNDLSGVKLLIWTDPQSDYSYGSQSYVLNSIGTETVSGAQCLVFQYNKLAAKQMGDVIYARAFVEKQGNTYYSEVKKYSVLQYVYNKTGRTGTPSTNQNLINLLEAMLEYGAKAQIYTNYKTNRLVTADYYQIKVVGGTLPDCCDSGLYALGEVVSLTAPSTDGEGNEFSYWENDEGEIVGTTETVDVTVISRNRTYTAVYGSEIPVIPDPEYSTGLAYADNGDGTCTITGIGTCTDLDVLIPPSIDGLTVSAIGEKAFENQSALTSIEIPDTVTTIGRRAFYGCTGLTEFTIPSSVTSIGTQIFFHADNIHTVYYNASYYPATETENQLLINPGITKVVFGSNYIGEYASRNLGLNGHITEVEIGNSVMGIENHAFYACINLTNATIENGVTNIGIAAFYDCPSLTAITIPDSVTNIGNAAFYDCISLTAITIPDSVTSIGVYAFYGCTELVSVKIGNSVTSIGDYTFFNCNGLVSVTIGNGVTSIGGSAFYNCTNLTEITIPASVTSICNSTFFGCSSLTEITIPDSVTSIGNGAFSGCSSLTAITIPDSVTSIGDYAFSGCSSLTEITIPNSVTSIGEYAFSSTGLTSVTIPDAVTILQSYTFSHCSRLSTVTLGTGLSSIEDRVFYYCYGLTDMYYGGTVSEWNSIQKGYIWRYYNSAFTVHCTDGDILEYEWFN